MGKLHTNHNGGDSANGEILRRKGRINGKNAKALGKETCFQKKEVFRITQLDGDRFC